jgi:hydroxymethylpyrimidine/phosphomethylpyrimidine kinase
MAVPKALTIAGSDSGGGAGIQADLKTFSAFRVFGMSVLTALTAQNSVGVHGVHDVPPPFVAAQIDAVLGDFGTDAIKVGMLFSAAIVEAVAARLADAGSTPIVLDPVMVAKGGDPLLQPAAREALIARMVPVAHIVTPNLPEAAALAGIAVDNEKDMEEAARRIHRMGPRHVLVKGGHLAGAATDVLFDGRGFTRFEGERIASANTHGTGCTLSSAIAAGLAHGRTLDLAIRDAKAYVSATIREGFRPGRGVGVLRHFVARW